MAKTKRMTGPLWHADARIKVPAIPPAPFLAFNPEQREELIRRLASVFAGGLLRNCRCALVPVDDPVTAAVMLAYPETPLSSYAGRLIAMGGLS